MQVGQLSTDPASEALVVVVVASTLTALATGSTVSGRGVPISGRGVGIAGIVTTALATVAGLSLPTVVVGVSTRVGVAVVVVTSSGRSRLGGVEGGCLDGGLLDDRVLDVEGLLD